MILIHQVSEVRFYILMLTNLIIEESYNFALLFFFFILRKCGSFIISPHRGRCGGVYSVPLSVAKRGSKRNIPAESELIQYVSYLYPTY
jgi:hypothetical protein